MLSMKQKPFFSVLVPVYNTQDYLVECLESVLKQTFTEYELVLVDDGSTDNSGAICDSYADKYSFIRTYHKKNQGLLHTRRFGIDKAKGDYLIFLDSDDLLHPNALQTIANVFSENPCDFIMYGWERRNDHNIRVDSFQPVSNKWFSQNKNEFALKILCDHDYNSLCVKSVKRSLFLNIDYSSFFSIQRGEDLLQTVEVLKNANAITMIPNILYMYRMNVSSITKKQDYDTDYSIRDAVSAFVENDLHFSSEDSCKYYSHCADDLINNVIHAIRSNLSVEKQNALFSLYKSSETYKMAIKKYSAKVLGWRCILVSAFSKKAYWFIRLIVSVYSLIGHS